MTFLLTLIESINLTSILIIILSNYGKYLDSKLIGLMSFIVLSLVNTSIFIKNRNYEKMIDEQNAKNSFPRNTFQTLLYLYYFTSLCLLAYAAILESTRGNISIVFEFFKKLL